jgi:hypothetical protein
MPDKRVTVMGSFVADLAFRAAQLPAWGQTILGSEFRIGPGGKGSNQAVAAARLGGAMTAARPLTPYTVGVFFTLGAVFGLVRSRAGG